MPRTPEESRKLFEKWAETYDRGVLISGGPLEGYESSLDEAADLLPVRAGDRVLDIGIGTGAFAARLARRGARITGVDPSPAMLRKCAEAHPEFALSEGSFLPLPFADGQFDAVVASFAFHEVAPADRPAACREMARVLRPGGHLCLLDIIFASPEATESAAKASGEFWDPEEEYPLVSDLDRHLRAAGFGAILWRQTGPMHWAVLARKAHTGSGGGCSNWEGAFPCF